MKEYRIQADNGNELAVSRWPDGKYSIRVFSSAGQLAAHLIVPRDEGEKLTDALNTLRYEFDMKMPEQSKPVTDLISVVAAACEGGECYRMKSVYGDDGLRLGASLMGAYKALDQ